MEGDDGVAVAEVDARADHAVHLLLHLSVAALHGVEVEVGAALVAVRPG